MPRPLVALVLVLATALCSCATIPRATAAAVASKALVESAYGPWDTYVGEQIVRCEAELPPAEHTKSEFDTCLGAAREHERVVVPLLYAYQLAALALFVALTTDRSDVELNAARVELARAVVELVRKIPAVNAKIQQAQRAIGGK